MSVDVDAGALACSDSTLVVTSRLSADAIDMMLQQRTATCVQALLDVVFALPPAARSESGGVGVLVDLPPRIAQIPRALPPPPPAGTALTRWEQFAKAKGIVKKKKTRRVFDETTNKLKVRYGFDEKRDRSAVPDDWLIEVKNSPAAPAAATGADDDAYAIRAREKSARISKNKAQQRRNMLENPRSGLTPKEARAIHLKEQIKDTRKSTASIGKFDKKVAGEENVKFKRPKRKFDDVTGDAGQERAKVAKIVEKVNKVANPEGGVIATKAVAQVAQQKRSAQTKKHLVKGSHAARKNKR
ncbi:Rhodanese- sulfurtransferase [Entophlyctis sp. JEL0112]|nr:Rhodanese- sulfurtransferase [Entophlyctis sp. JEL0112]